jgi:hypothetical protein
MVASPKRSDLLSLLAEVKQVLVALGNKTFFSVVVGSGGITINGGRIKITSSGGIQLPAGGTITDALGNIIFSADSLTGQRMSTPFLAVPAAPMWDGNDGAAFRTGGSTGDYVIQAAHCTTETTLWTGTIPQIVHPQAFWSGVIGSVTGSTSTPTYRLYLNGSLIDTRTTAVYGPYVSALRPISAITSFGSSAVEFHVTVQANTTSADYFAFTFKTLAMAGN